MEKLFNELGLEYLADRRWLRRLSFFFKINNKCAPSYLSDIIPERAISQYRIRKPTPVCNFHPRTDILSYSFFPYIIRTWNALDPDIRNLKSLSAFKNSLRKFTKRSPSPLHGIHNPIGIKLVTRLRMGLSHLRDHKFRHNFRDTINPLCPCNIEPETTAHYLLRCLFFSAHRKVLFDSIDDTDIKLTTTNDELLVKTLLYGSTSYSTESNAKILNAIITFVITSGRFNENLM